MNSPPSPDRQTAIQELRLALAVADTLDTGAEQLPYRVSLRLEQARRAALARVSPDPAAVVTAVAAPAPVGVRLQGAPNSAALSGGPQPAFWWRVCSVSLPLMLVVAGLIGISLWFEADEVIDTAEVDAGLVLNGDDLPVSALADRGFSVFLRNTRQ